MAKAKQRTYFCIDMKSFFASVECAEMGLNPFETNLIVADETRGEGTVCLAVTPKLKSLGVKNRCRVFEIPKRIKYITAKPRMKKYIEYASEIYAIYLKYISPEDIHVYSIDEAFIDATDYLSMYGLTAKQFAKKLVNEIGEKVKIPATVGIGSNLYLAKIALDITAKKCADHMGYLTEDLYRLTLWRHKPLTDFWGIGNGISARLAKMGIYTMEDITLADERKLYKAFGINAELIIDHAFGRESCTMQDIKNYKSKSKSLSTSQILFSDYDCKTAKIVIEEMALTLCQELISQKLIASGVYVGVGYSKNVIGSTGKSVKLFSATNSYQTLSKQVSEIYDLIVNPNYPVRKLSIGFNGLADEGCIGYDMFTDVARVEKERARERAVVDIKCKHGKNTIFRGADLLEGATALMRNKLIGGHNGE